ncbi:MAG: BON domain-containing protein [Candidatus Binataceae bacterium]
MTRKSFFYIGAPALALALAFGPVAFAQNSSTATNSNNAGQTISHGAHKVGNGIANMYHGTANAVSDGALDLRVDTALHENKFTRGHDIGVSSNHGNVTLSGDVPNHTVAEHAVTVAEETHGVRHVRNRMRIPVPAWQASGSRESSNDKQSPTDTNSSARTDSSSTNDNASR